MWEMSWFGFTRGLGGMGAACVGVQVPDASSGNFRNALSRSDIDEDEDDDDDAASLLSERAGLASKQWCTGR